jgi:hypothetical protein
MGDGHHVTGLHTGIGSNRGKHGRQVVTGLNLGECTQHGETHLVTRGVAEYA